MQSHRTIRKHCIPATQPYTGKVGRPVGTAPKLQGETVIILEDVIFEWTPKEMQDFREMWQAGISCPDIARYLKREDEDEILLLVLHEKRQHRIKEREGGWWGCLNA